MSEDKQQKEFRRIIEQLLALPHNKFCADCGASRPTWASSKIGVFICMKCAGIHRGLGTHISFVRSVQLDRLKASEVEVLQEIGNLKAAQIYEATLPPNYPRPTSADLGALEKFIRAKYQYKKFYSETPNLNIRRASTEKRPNLETDTYVVHGKEGGSISPRKVVRKAPPTQHSPTQIRAPEHLSGTSTPVNNTINNSNINNNVPLFTPYSQPTSPQSNIVNLFGPVSPTPTVSSPTTPNLFASLDVTPKHSPSTTPANNNNFSNNFFETAANDGNKACSTATKNEILGLFDGFNNQTPTYSPQNNNLLPLFGGMSIGTQSPIQYPPQTQINQQYQYQQQLLQQQLLQQQLLQQAQLQQQAQIQQQHDFALLNKIQAKSNSL